MADLTPDEQDMMDRLVKAAKTAEQAYVIVAAAFPNLDEHEIAAAIVEATARQDGTDGVG